MRKRILPIFTALILSVSALILPAQAAPDISAEAAVLMEAESRTVLFEKNMDQPLPIASTTKIMTAVAVLENCGLDEVVTVSQNFPDVEGSSIYLQPGDKVTVKTLLYGLLLESGNDAAVALACHTAGSIEQFTALMNDTAQRLELSCTHFQNPSGLDEEGHCSSAHDLAVLMAYAMENDAFAEICGTREITLEGRTFVNHNKLLWNEPDVLSGKTGYTSSAGRTLVSCAERDGMRLICVTLNDDDDWNDHAALFEMGFSGYRIQQPASCNDDMWEIPVISGRSDTVAVKPESDIRLLLSSDEALKVEIELPRFVYAPVDRGGTAGQITCFVNGERVCSTALVFTGDVPKNDEIRLRFFEQLKWRWLHFLEKKVIELGY